MPWDYGVAGIVLLTGGAYATAFWRLSRHAGRPPANSARALASFAAGWFALCVAFISPLTGLSDLLFAAHMTQHELLMLVAAPLIVYGRPLATLLWLAPLDWRRRLKPASRSWAAHVWRVVTGPVVALVLHAAVLWVWHVPALFEAALASKPLHLFQHLTFFWSAALFWWALLHGRYGRLGYGAEVGFVFVTAVHSSLLGALLTFAPVPLYPTHAGHASAMGVAPLEDQQLAGLLMWVPAGVLLTLVGLGLFMAWLAEAERRAPSIPEQRI